MDKRRLKEISKEVGHISVKTNEFVNAITLAALKYKTDLETNPDARVEKKSIIELNKFAEEQLEDQINETKSDQANFLDKK